MAGRRKLDILYEDDCIIVADKPSGLLTMSTGKEGEITAYSILTDYVRSARGGRNTRDKGRIFIVHRLDRDTSGVIVFAKDEQTKHALQDDWNETILERKYIAAVEGTLEYDEGTVASYLKDNPKSMKVSSSWTDNGGKYSVTHFKVLRSSGQYSLVEFELETGRKNQIRVHASVIGNPVAGDRKYGSASNPLHRLCLHASTLVFHHPRTGQLLRFDTGIPKDFMRLCR
ncbi:MAG: RluA family pseudouridine synthase [Bacteroidetes bacterium]|jgi:23S rRNA pseudouridine1911/1915/1917 synthase|uniref:Pseudouridine synthase n=1 Tax=Candidatus Cryptobacteroides faecigallinarum TaxID=2840763 RepID=A0A9D9NI50_9BACT|nr:RluA family pseudouridine synthase [Candidatus Cryptobacteroides faecigallinarum]